MASLYSSVGALTRLTARSSTMTGARTLRSLVLQKRSFMVKHTSLRSQLPVFTSLRYSSTATAAAQAEPEAPQPPAGIRFDSLNDTLHPHTLKSITGPMRLETLSVVQEKILPMLPDLIAPFDPENPEGDMGSPRDLLVKSKTGTGKTLAFLVPAIEARIKAYEDVLAEKGLSNASRKRGSHAAEVWNTFGRNNLGTLVISPTRELAMQIATEAKRLTEYHGFGVKCFVGGDSKYRQMKDWDFGTRDILVATPGRLMDMLESNKSVSQALAKTQLLILDEADTLLDMGFRDDIERIKRYLPPSPERQTFMFSATVSRAIQQVAQSMLSTNHAFVNCVPKDASPVHAHIPQYHTVLPSAEHQIPHLMRLIAHDQLMNPGASKIVVFFPTTKMTQMFSTFVHALTKACLPAGERTRVFEIHSQKSQESRTRTSDMFRKSQGESVLITSDVSARGVDYPGVTRVIQVGAPKNGTQYIHRVGRTGRAGTSGRGDLVLLPVEMRFVTRELGQVPMKPVTVSELETQLKELADELDSNPQEFLASSPGRNASLAHMTNSPTTPKIESIPTAVSKLLDRADPEAVSSTFMSLLGYYGGMSETLKASKSDILEEMKKWTVEGCGLPQEPRVSPTMLTRMGFSSGGNERKGSRGSRDPSWGGAAKPAWGGRGGSGSGGYERRSGGFGMRSDGESGGERRFGGDRPSFGGDRSFGERRSFGGERSYGGERSFGQRSFGGDRSNSSRSFGDRDGGARRQGGFGGRRQAFEE